MSLAEVPVTDSESVVSSDVSEWTKLSMSVVLESCVPVSSVVFIPRDASRSLTSDAALEDVGVCFECTVFWRGEEMCFRLLVGTC
eukprot:5337297-Ditylum_brightwellii.AAC.1